MGPRSYQQVCSVARALDLIGERWTLLLVRDLLAGPLGFNALLAGLPGLTTNLLAKRLKDLVESDLLEQLPAPPGSGSKALYGLTPAGRGLAPVVEALAAWGQHHAAPPGPDHKLSPRLLLLVLARRYQQASSRSLVQLECGDQAVQLRLGGARFEGVEGSPLRPDLRLAAGAATWHALLSDEQPSAALLESGRLVPTPGLVETSPDARDARAAWADFRASFQLT